MVYIIYGYYKGQKIKRIAYSDFQAFTIINQLNREGVRDISIREERR